MSDQLVVTEPEGTIVVPAATLASLVARAAELVDGARVRRPRRSIEIDVADGTATVTLQVAARYGAILPELAAEVQERVARAVEKMCGVEVRSVDVAIEELVER
jgi:uncharacterized alkaline shock family protein YloU